MSLMQGIWPVVGQLLLLAVLFTLIAEKFISKRRLLLPVVALLLVPGLFIPVYGLSVAQWIRSVIGDLSVFTLVIFANILASRLLQHKLLESTTRNLLLQGIALAALLFYPTALGLGGFDPYQLGYSPLLMSVLLCLASLVAWLKFRHGLAIILLLPLAGFNLHLLESGNLWDYLLDPIVSVYALLQIFAGSRLMRSFKS